MKPEFCPGWHSGNPICRSRGMPPAASAPACAQNRAAWSLYVSDSCALPTYQPVCMLIIRKSIAIEQPDFWLLMFSNFITSRQCLWKVGETVGPAVLGSSRDFGSPPLGFEL